MGDNMMNLDEALEVALNALADRPSGPDAKQVLAVIQAAAWDEGAEADADTWCLTAVPCGDCANCVGPQVANPYRPTK